MNPPTYYVEKLPGTIAHITTFPPYTYPHTIGVSVDVNTLSRAVGDYNNANHEYLKGYSEDLAKPFLHYLFRASA